MVHSYLKTVYPNKNKQINAFIEIGNTHTHAHTQNSLTGAKTETERDRTVCFRPYN